MIYYDFKQVPEILLPFYYLQAIGAINRYLRQIGRDTRRKIFLEIDEFGYAAQVEAVARLAVAWVHHTGDAREDNRSQIQCNPIVVGSVLYGTSAGLKAFALDAATGRELWSFDPFAGPGERPVGVNRGLMYWEEGGEARVLFGAGPHLYALDARTGRPAAG